MNAQEHKLLDFYSPSGQMVSSDDLERLKTTEQVISGPNPASEDHWRAAIALVADSNLDPWSAPSEGPETSPIHEVADSYVDRFEVAIYYAFAMGRRAVRGTMMGFRAAATTFARKAPKRPERPVHPILRPRFNVRNPHAARWAREHAAEMIKQITDTTRRHIRAAVVETYENGENYRETYDRVLKAVGSQSRARLIARQETMTMASQGQRESWHEAVEEGLLDASMKRKWIITGDEKSANCPICGPLAGQTAPLNGTYPGGYEGPPGHIQCRCTEGLTNG